MKSVTEKPLFLAVLVAALVLMYSPPCAKAATAEPVHLAAGANTVWLDGPGAAFPADVEAGATAWSSLSPHLSAFADAYYGFSHSYVRWNGGVKATVTDVDNPNFNVYLSAKYRGGSIRALHPGEWAFGTGFGWKPNPDAWPRLTLGGDAAYGAQSERLIAYLAVRYSIPLN
jgi:hypothetical protein